MSAVPYRAGKLDYNVLNELVFEHFKDRDYTAATLSTEQNEDGDNPSVPHPNKKDKNIMTEEVRDLYREIKKEFLTYIDKENIPLLVLFKRLDLENDDFLSFAEF